MGPSRGPIRFPVWQTRRPLEARANKQWSQHFILLIIVGTEHREKNICQNISDFRLADWFSPFFIFIFIFIISGNHSILMLSATLMSIYHKHDSHNNNSPLFPLPIFPAYWDSYTLGNQTWPDCPPIIFLSIMINHPVHFVQLHYSWASQGRVSFLDLKVSKFPPCTACMCSCNYKHFKVA